MENKKSNDFAYFCGSILGLFSTLFFFLLFLLPFFPIRFFTLILLALGAGGLSFYCFHSPKRIHLDFIPIGSASGLFLIFFLSGVFSSKLFSSDFFIFGLLSIVCSFFFLGTPVFNSIKKVTQTKPIQLLVKIILWGAMIFIGILVLLGMFSWVAGLSATSVIIILLILIWLK